MKVILDSKLLCIPNVEEVPSVKPTAWPHTLVLQSNNQDGLNLERMDDARACGLSAKLARLRARLKNG